jgi:hypothetical protein
VAPAYQGDPGEAYRPPEEPPSKGKGMIITGAILLGSSALPGIGAGTYCITNDLSSACDKEEGYSALTFGIIALGVGAPLLTFGIIRNRRYQEWKREHGVAITPTTGRTAMGTHTAGVEVRF